MARRKKEQVVCTLDFETDPFAHGEKIEPFAAGFYNGTTYHEFWGSDVVIQVIGFLRNLEYDALCYAHNGGKFDFLFMLDGLDHDPMVINGRLVKTGIGRCELRDSFAILPVPLKKMGAKGEIDYMKMKKDVRDLHRLEIMGYLRQDCLVLHDAVEKYRERFGDSITMASAAMKQLEQTITDETEMPARKTLQPLSQELDTILRQFYFGGRVECFEGGITRDDWNVYDMNSMYPFCMRRYEHPVSNRWECDVDPAECDFATINATSRGAFPFRAKDGSLSFPVGRGDFRVTGHEIRTAIELGLCDIHHTINSIRFFERRSFAPFVDKFFGLRRDAQRLGDPAGDLHYKLVLNSSYGRFALNAEKLEEFRILRIGTDPENDEGREIWERAVSSDNGWVVWKRPSSDLDKRRAIRNVATGASITGAARSELLRALHRSDRPIYCDTDSVFCRSADIQLGTELGMWKREASADEAAIAGKKLYALFSGGNPVKHACKGVKISPGDIRRVANGETILWRSEAPTMSLMGGQEYMTRTIRRTA